MKLIGEAIKNLVRKPFTVKYPKERPKIPEGLRGKLKHFEEKCLSLIHI